MEKDEAITNLTDIEAEGILQSLNISRLMFELYEMED
jgi:hypothetical protein